MSYFEGSGRCNPQEFDYFRPERLSAGELRLDTIYTLMLAYNYSPTSRHATKLATRITAMAVAPEGGIDIKYDTLDEDFNPVDTFEAQLDASGEWQDGYISASGDVVTLDGYFKGYDDNMPSPDSSFAAYQELAGVS